MSEIKKPNQSFPRTGRKLVLSLMINWLIPVILFTALRYFIPNDTTALAIVVAIPAVRTTVLLAVRRRIDWIGLAGVLGFAIALIVSVLSGGSSLPLKLYRPVLTGTLGLAFLLSVAIKKPLLLTIIRLFRRDRPEPANSSAFRKKINIMSLVFGLLLLGDAVVHIFMALTLPTGTFIGMSKLLTFAVVAILLAIRFLSSRNKKLK